jgi:integrase
LFGDGYVDHLQPMVLLAMNTGLRRGELFHLQWTDVDLSRNYLTVRGGATKSGDTRHVPLHEETAQALQRWHRTARGSTYVFPGKDGGRLTSIRSAWCRLLREANISDFRWHDLRHHFASQLVMASVDLNTVRELLGHSDIAMTLRYAHLSPDHKAEAVGRLVRNGDVAIADEIAASTAE